MQKSIKIGAFIMCMFIGLQKRIDFCVNNLGWTYALNHLRWMRLSRLKQAMILIHIMVKHKVFRSLCSKKFYLRLEPFFSNAMALSTANNHKFQVGEIVTIKASNDCELSYGKIKKIHDDNIHYDIEQLPSNAIKRGLDKDRIEMVALIQYAAYIREKGSPPKWPMQLINYAEENGIANKWIKYVDAKWIIANKPDITNYNRLPPPIRRKSTVSITSTTKAAKCEDKKSLHESKLNEVSPPQGTTREKQVLFEAINESPTILESNLQASNCTDTHDVPKQESQKLMRSECEQASNNALTTSKHKQATVLMDDDNMQPKNDPNKPWNCSLCTFENVSNQPICIMCKRGRCPESIQQTAEPPLKPERKMNVIMPDPIYSEVIQVMNILINDAIIASKDKYPLLLSTVLKFERM